MCCENKRPLDNGNVEVFDGEFWMDARDVCRHCENEDTGHYCFAEERHSFGCYAGKYCDACWKHSGYRDADDPHAKFDPMYAGERLYAEDDYFLV